MTTREIFRLRRNLLEPLPLPSWPLDVSSVNFDADRHAAEVHTLLSDAYADGSGGIPSFDTWWKNLRDDDEYDPKLVFLAEGGGGGGVVGVAQCWIGGFVKDIAVRKPWRRRGVGTALLLQVFRHFRENGEAHVDLKVKADNSSDAMSLYMHLGMVRVMD